MAIQASYHVLVLLVLLSSVSSNKAAETCDPPCNENVPFNCSETASFNRSSFGDDFTFGAATSAFQIEGVTARSFNIWDSFTHEFPEKTTDGSNGDVAVDSYHLYKDDVAMLKDMGLDAYRLSIAWSRLLPKGKLSGGVNKDGIQYYNNLINELKSKGIEPFVTLFHWDLPQTLQNEYGGFLSHKIVEDYVNYVDFCFKEFGDRVKYWITLNQPYTVSYKGYGDGSNAPGRCSAWQNLNCTDGDSGTEPYWTTHHQLLAHANAVDLYRRKYQAAQNGKIGITLISRWYIPYSNTKEDLAASQRAIDFMLGWFMDPLTKGNYPSIMKELVGTRLPNFTKEQSELVKGSLDFLGLNYYLTQYAIATPPPDPSKPSVLTDPRVNLTSVRNGVPIGPEAASFYYYPKGIQDLLFYIKIKYNNPLTYITENGFDDFATLPLIETLVDYRRINYHCSHLCFLKCAIRNGSNVVGYFVWALVDNFEFDQGYTVRFGMNYVDYKNVSNRQPKLSAEWFKRFVKKNTFLEGLSTSKWNDISLFM